MGRIARIARVKNGEVVSITMCDIDRADEMAKARGCDSWFEVDVSHGVEPEPIRMLEVGDKLAAKSGKSLNADGKRLDKADLDTGKFQKAPKAQLGA